MVKLKWQLVVLFLLAGCKRDNIFVDGPHPVPRDVESPEEISSELGRVRIPQREGEGDEEEGYFMRLDQSDYLEAEGCWGLSPSERYLVCIPNLGISTLELVDVETGERHVLVRREEAFPEAINFGYPSFTPDESAVIFAVSWSDHTDPAIVDIDTGEVQYLDAPGDVNTEPRISPGGSVILVSCAGTKTGAGFVLCLLDSETLERTYLVDKEINILLGSRFTPDGKSVVYLAPIGGIGGEGHLYRVDIESKEETLLVSGLASNDIVLGVSDEDVVFSCTSPEKPACSWVCVVGLDGRDVRRLTYLGESCTDINEP